MFSSQGLLPSMFFSSFFLFCGLPFVRENRDMASTFDVFVEEYKDSVEECLFIKVDLDKVSGISDLEPDVDKNNLSTVFPVFSVYDQCGRKAGQIQGSDPNALTDLILSCQ